MSQVTPQVPHLLAVQLVDVVAHVNRVVRGYCRRLADHDQKDLAQDALLVLIERLNGGACVDDLFPWLVAVVRNLHATLCRARRRHTAPESLSWPEDADTARPKRSMSPAVRTHGLSSTSFLPK